MTNKLNSLHIHVDGPDQNVIREVVNELNGKEFPTKVCNVLQFLAGPQRSDLPDIYTDHTAGSLDEERFGAFSKTSIQSKDIQAVMDIIFAKLNGTAGNVVELEEVIARCDVRGKWQEKATKGSSYFTDVSEFSASYPEGLVEIHHKVSFPGLKTDQGAGRLRELLEATNGLGIRVGGWFLFGDKNKLFFTTNKFVIGAGALATLKADHAQMLHYLHHRGEPHTFETLGEKVLVIKRVE